MKKLLTALFVISAFQSHVSACEFTSQKSSVKVQTRTVDYENYKEKIKTVGTTSGKFISNDSGSMEIFKTTKNSYPMADLRFNERETTSNHSMTTNVRMSGEALADIVKEAIGEKKLSKDSFLQDMVKLINTSQSYNLSSYYHIYYGGITTYVTDESEDTVEFTDPANRDNQLIVTFNFKRWAKCE